MSPFCKGRDFIGKVLLIDPAIDIKVRVHRQYPLKTLEDFVLNLITSAILIFPSTVLKPTENPRALIKSDESTYGNRLIVN